MATCPCTSIWAMAHMGHGTWTSMMLTCVHATRQTPAADAPRTTGYGHLTHGMHWWWQLQLSATDENLYYANELFRFCYICQYAHMYSLTLLMLDKHVQHGYCYIVIAVVRPCWRVIFRENSSIHFKFSWNFATDWEPMGLYINTHLVFFP